MRSSNEEIVEQVLSHTQMKFVGNTTVLFSHCIKTKAKIEEVEIRTSSRDKTVCEYRISFYQICIFEFAVKLHFADFQAVCALGLRCIVDVEFSRWRRRSRNFPGYMLYISIDMHCFFLRKLSTIT